MALLADLFATDRSTAGPWHPSDEAILYGLDLAPPEGASGVEVDLETALSSTALYAALTFLADVIGTLPRSLKRNLEGGGAETLVDDPIGRLVELEPNGDEDLDADTFFAVAVLRSMIWGRAPSRIRFSNGRFGDPIKLEPIHPRRVRPVRLKNRKVVYEVTNETTGKKSRLQSWEVLDLRGFTLDGYACIGLLDIAREAIGSAVATDRFSARFFGNGAHPKGVVEVPKQLQKKDKLMLEAEIQAAHSGKNQHKVLILPNGTTWNKIGATPEEAQMLEAKRWNVQEVSRLTRIPPPFLQDLEKLTVGNGEEVAAGLAKWTIGPKCHGWEMELRRKLLYDRPGQFFKHNLDAIVRGVLNVRMQAYATAIQNGILTQNEVRDLEDRNPMEGGDELRQQLNLGPTNEQNGAAPLKTEQPLGIFPPATEPPAPPKEPAAFDVSELLELKARLEADGLYARETTWEASSEEMAMAITLRNAAERCNERERGTIRRSYPKNHARNGEAWLAGFAARNSEHVEREFQAVAAAFPRLAPTVVAAYRHWIQDGAARLQKLPERTPEAVLEELETWDDRPTQLIESLTLEED